MTKIESKTVKIRSENDDHRKVAIDQMVNVAIKRNKTIGITLIILGVLMAFTVIGMVIAWLPILVGVYYIKSIKPLTSIISGNFYNGFTDYIKTNNRISYLLILLFATQLIFTLFFLLRSLFIAVPVT